MASAFTWDDEHTVGAALFPFVTAREAWWVASALGLSVSFTRALPGVDLSASVRGEVLRVDLETAQPDSYSPEIEEMQEHPERWRAKAVARLDAAALALDARFEEAGLTALAAPSARAGHRRAEGLRTDRARAMPPTRRRSRYASAVVSLDPAGYTFERGRRADARTVFCDSATGEAVARVPLVPGETYWVTGEGDTLATVDVAVVSAAALLALEPEREACAALGLDTSLVDLHGFLARELQYGPLDARASAARFRARLFERHEALTTEAGSVALANSLAAILARVAPGAPLATIRDASAMAPTAILAGANDALARAGDGRRFVPATNEAAIWILHC